jgi:hypothetical protein
MSRLLGCSRCNHMPHPFFGLLFSGLVIRTVIAVVVIAAVLWLVFKLGRLADAYTEKLRAK